MKLPNWFKIAWWLVLTGALTAFLICRYPDLVVGRAAAADVVVFVVWIALLLAPLFSEVSLLGVTLKQELDELKNFVSSQFNEIRNAVDVRTTFSPQFYWPSPPADAQLPDLEARIKSALSETLATHGLSPAESAAPLAVPDGVALLFGARYHVERELRRIAEGHQYMAGSLDSRRPPAIAHLVRSLAGDQIIEPSLADAVREVYAVCSPAIHGEKISAAQLSFIEKTAPKLVATLRAIK